MRRLAAAALLVLAMVGLAGCGLQDRGAVEQAVRDYDRLLPLAYSKPDAEVMRPVAGANEVDRVLMFILYLRKEKNATLDTRMLDLRFDSVASTDDGAGATVRTTEHWEWRYIDAGTHASKGGYEQVYYRSTYTLKKQDGRWVVVSLDVKQSATEGGLPK